MVIVIVHWKIHPHDEARAAFLKFWKESLEISERENLVGEFLSEPLAREKAGFACSVMNTPASPKYDSFFNVGIWRSKDDFEAKVVTPFVTDKPKTMSFEYEYRERMILNPLSVRAGEYPVPTADEFAP